jgi:hypothetical protein
MFRMNESNRRILDHPLSSVSSSISVERTYFYEEEK